MAAARKNRPKAAVTLKRPSRFRAPAVILGITLLAYVNSTGGQFLYDDKSQILENPTLASLANIPRVFSQSVWQFASEGGREPVGAYYRPLFNAALIANYHLFGFETAGWHLVSLLVHLGVTLCVYLLALRWGMPRETGLAAALLFGLHPVHSESVAWISGLPDPLAAIFLLPALLLYEQSRVGASAALALLALLSKEVAIAFPVFLFLREALDRSPGESAAAVLTRAIRRTAPYFALAALYLGLRYAVLGFLSKPDPRAAGIPDVHVWLTVPSILLGYLRLLVMPFPLAAGYDHAYVSSASDPRFWVSAVAVAALGAAAVRLVRPSPAGRRALLFLAIFLVPVLNLKAFNPDESLLHDRYLYLPSVGFCLLAGLALGRLHTSVLARQGKPFWPAPALLGLVFFGLTVRQNQSWRSDYELARQAVEVAPRRPFFLDYLGSWHFRQKNYAEAERLYRAALEVNPRYYESLSNLAEVYRAEGRLADAEQVYRKAIDLSIPYAHVYANLGALYAIQRRFEEAEAALRKAVEMQPKDVDARNNLGWVYDQQGKAGLAEQAYREVLRLDPSHTDARQNLNALLARQAATR